MVRYAALVSLLCTACITGEFTDEETPDGDDAAAFAGAVALEVVQHNIEKKEAPLQLALQKAMNRGAVGITLQEVCPSQVKWLHDNFDGKWTIGVIAASKPALTGCEHPMVDVPSNVVIYTGGAHATVTPYPNLTGIGAPGEMVCVEFQRGKVPIHLCSTHLNSVGFDGAEGDVVRLRATTRIKNIARNEWFGGAKNHFAIIGGDFNGKPTTEPLDRLYDQRLPGNGNGDFTEYNRPSGSREGATTAATSGDNSDGVIYKKKIDYVFFSTNRAPLDGPNVDVIQDASDHNMVISSVHMKK
jgi:hypothetical protein